MKIVITGGTGLLGINLYRELNQNHNLFFITHNRELNFKNCKSVKIPLDDIDALENYFVKINPDLVIHSAALTNLIDCELDQNLCNYINFDLTKNVTNICSNLNLSLCFISTDQLFAGNKMLVTETEPKSPLNNYALSKSASEDYIINNLSKYLIVRTNFYGWGSLYRQSLSDKIINKLENNDTFFGFSNVYFTPILVNDLIDLIMDLVKKKYTGIYNIAGSSRITKYDFAIKIAEEFGFSSNLVKKVTYENDFLIRPMDMSLSNSKVENILLKKIPDISIQLKKLKKIRALSTKYDSLF